jgi:type II secretory pathway pseudopilin PulG
MLKKSASFVLASFRSSTYPRGYASGSSLAAALLNGLFEPPAGVICGLSSIGPESYNSSFNIHNSTFAEDGTDLHLTAHPLRASHGFTILEIIIVLFLLVGLLGIVLPRISLEENLGSVGRRMVGTVRSLQSLAMSSQKTVRLYVDMDRGLYWPVILDGNQEKVPTDATWATPSKLTETIRFSDILVSQGKKESGRVDLFFYPTGRIDPATMHLVDASNNILAIAIEPVTGAIRMSDGRIEPPRPLTIPDRVRPLLQTAGVVK